MSRRVRPPSGFRRSEWLRASVDSPKNATLKRRALKMSSSRTHVTLRITVTPQNVTLDVDAHAGPDADAHAGPDADVQVGAIKEAPRAVPLIEADEAFCMFEPSDVTL